VRPNFSDQQKVSLRLQGQRDAECRSIVELIIVDEIQCTAIENEWESPPNPLMHPPCQCPKCKVDPIEADPSPGRLRASGMRQRPAVEAVELGTEGQDLL